MIRLLLASIAAALLIVAVRFVAIPLLVTMPPLPPGCTATILFSTCGPQ